MSKPAVIPSWRRGTRLGVGQRTIKMLRPICAICQGEDNVPADWAQHCEHSPYVTTVATPRKKTLYEGDRDKDGKPVGPQKIVGTETIEEYEARPNVVEVALSRRVNQGQGVRRGVMYKGYIRPDELRSPEFPDGIAPACQYRGCKYQQDLKEYRSGVFCREIEAALVQGDFDAKILEVPGLMDTEERRSQRKRAGQLAALAAEAKGELMSVGVREAV